MKNKAITLVELLIVVAILVLVAVLLFPVLSRSKKAARGTACTANLRQAYVAWSLYSEGNDGRVPLYIKEFIDRPSEFMIIKCPLDDFDPGANRDASIAIGKKVSYEYPYPIPDFWSKLEEADPNHGILVCVLHGERFGPSLTSSALMNTEGLVMRLRRDGSVSRAQVGRVCSSAPGLGVAMFRSTWTLMTDEWPCPEPYCPAGSYKCP